MSVFGILRMLAYLITAIAGAYITYAFRKTIFKRGFPITRSLALLCGALGFYGLVALLVVLDLDTTLQFPLARDVLTLPAAGLAGTMVFVSLSVRERVEYLKNRSTE